MSFNPKVSVQNIPAIAINFDNKNYFKEATHNGKAIVVSSLYSSVMEKTTTSTFLKERLTKILNSIKNSSLYNIEHYSKSKLNSFRSVSILGVLQIGAGSLLIIAGIASAIALLFLTTPLVAVVAFLLAFILPFIGFILFASGIVAVSLKASDHPDAPILTSLGQAHAKKARDAESLLNELKQYDNAIVQINKLDPSRSL